MEKILYFKTESEYNNSTRTYPTVSYVKEIFKVFVEEKPKEEVPKIMTMKYVIDDTNTSTTISNDTSMFKSLTINDGENLIKETENQTITCNKTDFVVNNTASVATISDIDEQSESETYYVPSQYITTPIGKLTIKTSKPISDNDYLLAIMGMQGMYNIATLPCSNEEFTYIIEKINDTTYQVSQFFINEINSMLQEGGMFVTFGFIEGYEGIENDINYEMGINQNSLNHIIDSSLEYEGINIVQLPSKHGEYIVKCELKEDVTSIGNGAFYQCHSLSEITIPNSVTSIGNHVFYECSGLTSIEFPSSVTSIGDYAFEYCYSLTNIEIPNSVESIGNEAFYKCSGLTSVTFEECSHLQSIGERAFSYCSSLSSIEIPSSLTSIGYQAFIYCKALTSITIPSGVTSIDNNAFSGCTSLSSVTFAEDSQLQSIGIYAFANCPLSSVIIPNSVTSIEYGAFGGCRSLSSVTFEEGSQLQSIGTYAFYHCNSLSEITCLATTAPSIQSDTFKNVASNGILKYPNGSDYSSWLSTNDYYLGYYKWKSQEI